MGGFSISPRQVRAIADGSSTAADLDLLLAGQRSKSLTMLALVPRLAAEARHPEAVFAADGWRLLERVQQRDPRAVDDLICYPAVGAWATEALLGLSKQSSPGAPPGLLSVVAAAAAIRAGFPCAIELPPSACAEGVLNLPSLGQVLLPRWPPDRIAVLRHRDDTTEITGPGTKVTLPARLEADAANWHAVSVITPRSGGAQISMRLDDVDPHQLTGYEAQLKRLARPAREDWLGRLSGGWHLLQRDHPETANEVRALITVMTPLNGHDSDMVSVTSRRAFGCIALSLPADDVTMALTLAHEVQHAKLSALMDLVPLVVEPASGLYCVPWRSDPRPLASMLQGMYAHLEVARFWRRQREVTREPAEVHYAHVEYARWRQACGQVATVLNARPELTPCGSLFVEGMTNVVRGWRHDYVPHEAQACADRAISSHRTKRRAYLGALASVQAQQVVCSGPKTGMHVRR